MPTKPNNKNNRMELKAWQGKQETGACPITVRSTLEWWEEGRSVHGNQHNHNNRLQKTYGSGLNMNLSLVPICFYHIRFPTANFGLAICFRFPVLLFASPGTVYLHKECASSFLWKTHTTIASVLGLASSQCFSSEEHASAVSLAGSRRIMRPVCNSKQ